MNGPDKRHESFAVKRTVVLGLHKCREVLAAVESVE